MRDFPQRLHFSRVSRLFRNSKSAILRSGNGFSSITEVPKTAENSFGNLSVRAVLKQLCGNLSGKRLLLPEQACILLTNVVNLKENLRHLCSANKMNG